MTSFMEFMFGAIQVTVRERLHSFSDFLFLHNINQFIPTNKYMLNHYQVRGDSSTALTQCHTDTERLISSAADMLKDIQGTCWFILAVPCTSINPELYQPAILTVISNNNNTVLILIPKLLLGHSSHSSACAL